MSRKVLVVGAVALGPKAACRLKRLDPSAEITIIDKDYLISYGGCGIPYYVGGDVTDIEGLYSTASHHVRDREFFEKCKDVKLLCRTELISIDRKAKIALVRHLDNDETEEMAYDRLVLATGSTPVQPPIPGVDLPGVTVMANLHNAIQVKDMISKGKVSRAVVIGGGAIGVELAESLTDLWDVETTLIEMMDQLLPPAFGKDMSRLIENHMTEKGVNILLEEGVTRILGDEKTGVTGVETNKSEIPCDLVIVAVGVRPSSQIAREAGLAIGMYGGILVDKRLRTTDPNIYAGGDCIEMTHLVSGQRLPMPLGSLANRQGRIIGTNLNGGWEEFKGTVGTFCLKVFDMGIARAGLTVKQAEDAGFDPVYAVVAQSEHAHFYPDHALIFIKLIADRNTRKLLGIEAVGSKGDAVKARVDAVAALFQYNADVSGVSNLEVSYAPPYASAMDVVNAAGNTLENIILGRNIPIDVADLVKKLEKNEVRVLDVRGKIESRPFIEKYGDRWINIPQEELPDRFGELPVDQPLCLLCDTGLRSFETQIFLGSRGITRTRNIQGGYGMLMLSYPEILPA
ncbi:MAG: pyridine nucleotide-disulfide oxidoreductase [Deltaproteobacteria bacterium]|nr:MAG: pyridine nucleotide-disulfide oxidoreductase [Deltaproteobacteria bacterium]